MGGDQYRSPLVAQLAEDLEDPLARGAIDAAQRLVEQQHAGVLYERPGDQDALALAAGERAEPAAALGRQPDALERVGGGSPLHGAEPPVPGQRRVGPHQDDVECAYREVEPGALGLRHVGGGPAEPDLPAAVGSLPEQGAEQGRLTAAVGAEHGDRPTRFDGEVEAGDDGRPGRVTGLQAACLDERPGAHWAPLTAIPTSAIAKTAPESTAIAAPGGTSSS